MVESSTNMLEISSDILEILTEIFEISSEMLEILTEVFEISTKIFEISTGMFDILTEMIEILNLWGFWLKYLSILSRKSSRAWPENHWGFSTEIFEDSDQKPLTILTEIFETFTDIVEISRAAPDLLNSKHNRITLFLVE